VVALLFYTVDGDTATLVRMWDEEFDFDDDGTEEPAILTLELTRP
jgi:hypothetical protein